MGLFPTDADDNDEVTNNNGTTFKYVAADDKWVIVSTLEISDVAYNEGTWDANTDAATKNAIRDKIESMGVLASKQIILPLSIIPEPLTVFGGYRWQINTAGDDFGASFYCDPNIVDTSKDVEFLFVIEARATDAANAMIKYMAAIKTDDSEAFSWNVSGGGAFTHAMTNTKMSIITVAETTFAAASINGGDTLCCQLRSNDANDIWLAGLYVRFYLL